MNRTNDEWRRSRSRAEKLHATSSWVIGVGKSFRLPTQKPVASSLLHGRRSKLQDVLLIEKPLRASGTKGVAERCTWQRIMNSGTVIVLRIGQLACLSPKPAICKGTVRRQRLNGHRSLFEETSNLLGGLRYSPPLSESSRIKRLQLNQPSYSLSSCLSLTASRYLNHYYIISVIMGQSEFTWRQSSTTIVCLHQSPSNAAFQTLRG